MKTKLPKRSFINKKAPKRTAKYESIGNRKPPRASDFPKGTKFGVGWGP